MTTDRVLIHATAIALGHRAAIILGPSGSGKSDLALRCLALPVSVILTEPMRLIADDQVWLDDAGGHLLASCPPAIRGKLEVRGVGIIDVEAIESASVVLVVELSAPRDVPRMPEENDVTTLAGRQVRRVRLAPFEGAAPLKLVLALRQSTVI